MPFRRSRSLYDRERSRPVTPSAEGYLGPNELRDVSRSPIVTAGDEDDDEGAVPECEQSYTSDATTSKKSILKVVPKNLRQNSNIVFGLLIELLENAY